MKNNFLKMTFLAIILLAVTTAIAQEPDAKCKDKAKKMTKLLPEYEWTYPYILPELPYDYNGLEPVIDETTMRVHHTKHHQGYTNKTNAALKETDYQDVPLLELFSDIENYPAAVRNNGGGFYNHTLFWSVMTPGGSEFEGPVRQAIEERFGSIEEFQKVFEDAAKTQFGSGWAWLVMTPEGQLEVTNSSNQDNPLMSISELKGIPLLNLDVWEHAYYLKYQNKRSTYVHNFWDIVDWDTVNVRYTMAKKILERL
jgi:Fe-Mn family superoxide dismutase